MANKPQPSRLAEKYQTYPTANAAAVAALRGMNSSEKFERGGGILYNKEQDVYAATDPVGQNDGSHFAAAVSVPQGWKLHSTYHTHPSGPLSTQFSGDDISTSQQLKAPSYILAHDDNKIRVFDPANSKLMRDTSSSSVSTNKVSNGSPVDETPPTPPAAAVAPPEPAPPVSNAPATTTPVSGSRITMKDFVAQHRAQTTKYRHKIVHVIK